MSLFNEFNCFRFESKRYEKLVDHPTHQFRVILGDDHYDYIEDGELVKKLIIEYQVHKITEYLWEHESAPSAVNFVTGMLGIEPAHDPYDMSEGTNDNYCEQLLRGCSTQDRLDISLELMMIMQEKITDFEENL